MARATVITRVLTGDQLECRVTSGEGPTLTLTGTTGDVEPAIEGWTAYVSNRALIDNAWAFAKFTHLKVSLPTPEEQEYAEKRAKAHKEVVEWLADLADDVVVGSRSAWCSSCFDNVRHQECKRPFGHVAAFLCTNCGSPTLLCAAPTCDNMAVRGRGALSIPRYCAEHRHEIPGFAKAEDRIESLEDYRKFLEYEKPHLSRATKLTGSGLAAIALVAPAALFAAPAIGGAVGSLIGGYSGAAASSYGLALLGGGSLAAGGFGMAGGTAVVGAVGGALGGALGASLTNAYLRDDKSFRIEKVQDVSGTPVIVCNGFLSEGATGWGEWQNLVATRYPEAPVYRVAWGAKELRDLGVLAGFGALKGAGTAAVKKAAATATKQGAAALGPLGPVLVAQSLLKNPWSLAKSRADKTGAIVADLLSRTDEEAYVLVGHSLGARVMAIAARALLTKPSSPHLEVHLTGAAIGSSTDWHALFERDDVVHNYHSANDKVLKYLYGAAMAGQQAAGLVGFRAAPPNLRNVDVSDQVGGHTEYYANVTLR